MKVVALAVAAVGLVFSVAPASAATLFDVDATASTATAAPAGTTFTPGALGAVGGMDGGPIAFVLGTPGLVAITLEDCCLVGDVYEVIVDGTSVGLTSQVPIFGTTNSSGIFQVALSAGAHAVDVWNIVLSYLDQDSPFGGGIVPPQFDEAGFRISAQVVPVPFALPLFATGLVALAIPAFRRQKAQ